MSGTVNSAAGRDNLSSGLLVAVAAGIVWLIVAQRKGVKQIMLTQAELEQGLKDLTAQQGKIAAEQAARSDALLAKIAELEKQLQDGPVSPGVEAAFNEVKVASQALDDSIPDAPPA